MGPKGPLLALSSSSKVTYACLLENLLIPCETVLGDTANLLAMACSDVQSWSLTACATSLGCRYRLMLPVVTRILVKYKTTKKQ